MRICKIQSHFSSTGLLGVERDTWDENQRGVWKMRPVAAAGWGQVKEGQQRVSDLKKGKTWVAPWLLGLRVGGW